MAAVPADISFRLSRSIVTWLMSPSRIATAKICVKSTESYYSQYSFDNQGNYYNLAFKDPKQTAFSIGDHVAIQYYNKDQVLPDGAGQFLYYRLANGLVDYQISGSAEYDFNFEQRFFPAFT